MDAMTLEGPVVIIPQATYSQLVNRISQLESTVAQLTQFLERLDDVKVMREAEAEYWAGDRVDFADLLAEVQSEAT